MHRSTFFILLIVWSVYSVPINRDQSPDAGNGQLFNTMKNVRPADILSFDPKRASTRKALRRMPLNIIKNLSGNNRNLFSFIKPELRTKYLPLANKEDSIYFEARILIPFALRSACFGGFLYVFSKYGPRLDSPLQIRLLRVYYAIAAVLYAAALSFIRWKIVKKNELTPEIVSPPPPWLEKLLNDLNNKGKDGNDKSQPNVATDLMPPSLGSLLSGLPFGGMGGSGGGGIGGMVSRFAQRRVAPRTYDLAIIDSMRRGLFYSLAGTYIFHFYLFRINGSSSKMMLYQPFYWMWALVNHPIFQIHAIGRAPPAPAAPAPAIADKTADKIAAKADDSADVLCLEGSGGGSSSGSDGEVEGDIFGEGPLLSRPYKTVAPELMRIAKGWGAEFSKRFEDKSTGAAKDNKPTDAASNSNSSNNNSSSNSKDRDKDKDKDKDKDTAQTITAAGKDTAGSTSAAVGGVGGGGGFDSWAGDSGDDSGGDFFDDEEGEGEEEGEDSSGEDGEGQNKANKP